MFSAFNQVTEEGEESPLGSGFAEWAFPIKEYNIILTADAQPANKER